MKIPSEIDGKLHELLRIFLAENAKLNLSALRTEEACWVGNIEDSLSAMEVLESSKLTARDSKILDLGTGGGFPLLPLAIALPKSRCTGLDSTKKKIDAVGRIAKDVGIKNVELIPERAEVLGRNHRHREHYDIVTSRAVAPINILLEYCSPFVKVDGIILLWKSLHIDDELNQSKKSAGSSPLGTHRKARVRTPARFWKTADPHLQKNCNAESAVSEKGRRGEEKYAVKLSVVLL